MPALTLSILNLDRMPDGGPLQFVAKGQRGLEIGRDQYLDWTLPDTSRVVSSRHCEVQFRDGGYWLHDVSTNGTFVNGNENRMAEPHRLRQGDRFEVGPYIIGVQIEGDVASTPPAAMAPVYDDPHADPWQASSAAPPIAAHELRPAPPREQHADLMDWFVDIPDPQSTPAGPAATGATWGEAVAAPAAAPPPPPPPQVRELSSPPVPALPRADWTAPTFLDTSPPQPDYREASLPPRSVGPAQAPQAGHAAGTLVPARAAMEQPFREPAPPPYPDYPPPPVERPAPPPPTPRASASAPAGFDLAGLLARGAGMPADIFAKRTPEELAVLSGALLRITAENLKQMLMARAETKGLVRSTNQTMIQAFENNPLKFSPTVEDALRIMFGPTTQSYLDARRALEDSFRDIKSHQLNTYVAMQQALKMLVEDLDPEVIDKSTEKEGGLGGMIGSRKAKLWDLYMTRWKAKTARHDNGLVDAFMLYFSECYDRLASKLRS